MQKETIIQGEKLLISINKKQATIDALKKLDTINSTDTVTFNSGGIQTVISDEPMTTKKLITDMVTIHSAALTALTKQLNELHG